MFASNALAAAAKRFNLTSEDEHGAVTVDWVVLTSALIIFGLLAWSIIDGAVQEGASDIRAGVLSATEL